MTVITGAGDIVSGTLTDGWYLFRGTFTVSNTIIISGAVNIILENGCNVTVAGDQTKAGISVGWESTLTVYAQSADENAAGALTATGGDGDGTEYGERGGAGIGSSSNSDCGTIIIAGGIIAAVGGERAAGIGSSYAGRSGTIIIAGGIIAAVGGERAAGIGNGAGSGGGTTLITGGTVTATGGAGTSNGDGGAGIGGGWASSVMGVIITGGTVTAGGTDGGAGIGSGNGGIDTIEITGGTIVATGSHDAAGIGGGHIGFVGTIIITYGTITAIGGYNGAGIGGGYGSIAKNINISGGIIAAAGSDNAAGIGAGGYTECGSILIYGEDTVIYAVGGYTGIGATAGTNIGETFIAVKYGNLTGPNGLQSNAAVFTADPATAAGTVTATLPYPFTAEQFGMGVIELMTGLGPNASASIPSKIMSVHTTFDIQSIMFALDDYDNSPIAKTGTELITPGVSVDFRRPYNLTVNIIGDGSVKVSDGNTVYGIATASSSGSTFKIPNGAGNIYFTAVNGAGYVFSKFSVNSADSDQNPLAAVIDSDTSVTAVFAPAPAVSKQHYITASSDPHSDISPKGVLKVQRGGSMTFFFSADAGYSVSSVTVDGAPLTREQIGLGYYTFRNVMANHHIEVKSTASSAANLTLTVEIKEGKGRTEYSVDGSPFKVYTEPVTVPAGSNAVLKAYADKGHSFREWRTGGAAHPQPEFVTGNISSSMHFDLYFAENKGSGSSFPWWIFAVMTFIILTGVLIWLALYRRGYDVFKPKSVIGKDRALRNSEYRFRIKEYSGEASYRIGEDGEWKLLSPDADGVYAVPRKEVTGDIYLKEHL